MTHRASTNHRLPGAALLLALALAAFVAPGCSNKTPEQKECIDKCGIATNPVCGADGKTYNNECMGKCMGEIAHQGECKQ